VNIERNIVVMFDSDTRAFAPHCAIEYLISVARYQRMEEREEAIGVASVNKK
jgi:hypothetical protein